MFFLYHFSVWLLCSASLTIYGMEDNSYNHLIKALIEGNSEQLRAITTSRDFVPNCSIDTLAGPMDPIAYLILQTFPDASKIYELVTILHDAGVRIILPSQTDLFTAFHHAKNLNIFQFLLKKANIIGTTEAKKLLDRYYENGKETLFLKLTIELFPFEEIKKIYNTYKPDLHFKITADGTILHHLLAFYLFNNLNAQLYYSSPVERIADIVSEDMFRFAITYN